ncbi:MAG: hypothetical protein ACMUEL_05495 [Flavobacteriales bacterium Tduv]
MQRSTRRSDFFKFKTLIHWEVMEKNKENISKRPRNKIPHATVEYRYLTMTRDYCVNSGLRLFNHPRWLVR